MTADTETASLWHLMGNKARAKMGGQLNESASTGVTSQFAKDQLAKLGWKEGQGLGKRRQGRTEHIRVKKRAEGAGLGSSTSASLDQAVTQSIGNEWWKDSVGDTLARLGGKTKKKKKSKKVYTDEELFEATGGARFGMRAQTQQHGKWNRSESQISKEDEEEAKAKVEWDGKSAPVVKLPKSETSKKRKRDDKEEKAKVSDDSQQEEKAKKKKKKKQKSEDGESKKKKTKKKNKKE